MGRLLLVASFLLACHPYRVSAFQAVNIQYGHFGQQSAALRSPQPSFIRSEKYGITHNMRWRSSRLSSTVHDTGVIEGVKDFFQDEIKVFIQQSALAGTVKRGLSNVRLTPQKTKLIMAGMAHAVHIEELILYFYFGWLFMPTIYAIQSFRHRNREVVQTWTKNLFKKYGTLVADHISQLSKLCFCIYVVDIIKIILQGMGFAFASKFNIANVFGRISFTLWISNRVSATKRFVLATQTRSNPEDLEGQVQIVDRLFDALIYFVGVYVCLDTLKTKLGAFQKGFAALGGAGTLLLSLASQGLLSQLLNGLFVASSNQFAKGDIVKFSNNLQGKIVNLGWTSTVLRGSDVSAAVSFLIVKASLICLYYTLYDLFHYTRIHWCQSPILS